MSHLDGNLFLPILFRALQAALESAPTFLCGLVIAGLLRGMVGAETLRRWFTNDPRVGPIRACLIGLLLPVCSLGVLPVAWELRRAGIARATVLTFLLSAPLANPISLAFAYQRLESHGSLPVSVFIGLLLAAFAVLAGMGVLLGLWLPETAAPSDLPPLPASASRRLGIVGLTAAHGPASVLILFVFAGLLGNGLLALYPGGALEHAVIDRSLQAPLRMALTAFPAQVSPGQGNMLLCEMLFMGVSIGSAFIFLLLGIGFNLGTAGWIAWVYGFRVMVCMVLFMAAAALAVGYAVPFALPNLPPDAAHSRHFLEIDWTIGVEVSWTRAVKDTLFDDRGQLQWFGVGPCVALGVLALAGLICWVIGEPASIRYQMTRLSPPPRAAGSASPWNQPLSRAQLSLAALVLLLAIAGVVLYVFYPSPSALLDEMSNVQIELNLALQSKTISQPDALRLVEQWQRLQNKLALGDFLRRGRFDPRLRQASEELRKRIDQLHSALVEKKSAEELKALYAEARNAAMNCRQALEPGGGP